MIELTREQVMEIKKKYSVTLVTDNDVSNALLFARELLCKEAEAVQKKHPYATNTIRVLASAAIALLNMESDYSAENYAEDEDNEASNNG